MPHRALPHPRPIAKTRAMPIVQTRDIDQAVLNVALPQRAASRLSSPFWAAIKRTCDVVLAAAGLLVVLPVLVLASIAVMLQDPGPWWYGQTREGRGGRPFRIWKLRTMFVDAEARLSVHLHENPYARGEWNSAFKLSRDPRVLPRVGAVLRRWSLDECPQFWNVIRGDMSLVGPRALPDYHLDAFSAEFREARQRVRPGMTGLWQVMSRGQGAVHTQEAFDSYYIANWSVWMDFVILAKTVQAVLSGRGAK